MQMVETASAMALGNIIGVLHDPTGMSVDSFLGLPTLDWFLADAGSSKSGTSTDPRIHRAAPEPKTCDTPAETWDSWMRFDDGELRCGLAERWIRWKAAVRLSELRLEADYEELAQRSKDNSWAELIGLDAARTFPSLRGKPEAPQPGSLRRMLGAYAVHRPSVGYCQGMNYVAGLLLVMSSQCEEEAFGVFVCLMDNFGLAGFYHRSFDLLIPFVRACECLLERQCPCLKKHLESQDVFSSMYIHEWFLTLFLNSGPLLHVLEIWDAIIQQGLPCIAGIAVAILKSSEESLLKADFDELVVRLKRCCQPKQGGLNLSQVREAIAQSNHEDVSQIISGLQVQGCARPLLSVQRSFSSLSPRKRCIECFEEEQVEPLPSSQLPEEEEDEENAAVPADTASEVVVTELGSLQDSSEICQVPQEKSPWIRPSMKPFTWTRTRTRSWSRSSTSTRWLAGAADSMMMRTRILRV
eukprot:TRINITY_DN3113_c0_g1_i1.p1 TRINITY_DN3113_c0_g1~~TRINITY_DN3113_c0_g1_i1.p1  ORF type:complete len:469 (-),score=85.33 TRINITY_DN3113_c0_g1_i1:575-1981(-)